MKQNIFFKIRNSAGDNDTKKAETNRKKLDATNDDWWIEKLDVEGWTLKHFKMTRDRMQSENNIAYTKMLCQAVTSEVSRRLGKKDKNEVREMVKGSCIEPKRRVNSMYRLFITK